MTDAAMARLLLMGFALLCVLSVCEAVSKAVRAVCMMITWKRDES